jgi:hypothetical protein
MTCRCVAVGHRTYRFCPDQSPVEADRLRSVLRARLVDEITGKPPTGAILVRSERVGLHPRVAAGGIVGLIGKPARLFPHLGASSVDIDLVVEADRYVRRQLVHTLGPMGPSLDYPEEFAPADLGDIPLHREATTIRGRMVLGTATGTTPLPTAKVGVTGVWLDLASIISAPGASPPYLVSLSPAVYQDLSGSGGVTLRRREVTLQTADRKTLVLPVASGAAAIQVSDRKNLSPGDLVAIDSDTSDRTEYLEVTAIEGASTVDQSAAVNLALPCAYDHLPGATVTPVAPQAPGTDNTLNRRAIPGDRCVFLDTMTGLAAASVVEIVGGAVPEYHQVLRFEAYSDSRGYYRLPPLARVAQLKLQAEHPATSGPLTQMISPDYRFNENRIDLVFR